MYSNHILDMITSANLSQKYAFTITLKPSMYKWSAREQFMRTYKQVKDVVKHLGPATIVAELTRNGNIHYHGVLQFFWKVDYKGLITQRFHEAMRNHCNLFGHHNITPVTDEDGWVGYLKKGQESFLQTVEIGAIVSDEFSYFTPDIIKQLGLERPPVSEGSLRSPSLTE